MYESTSQDNVRWVRTKEGKTVPWRSESQAALLRKLIRDAAFNLKEHNDTYQWIKTPSCTSYKCSIAINKAMEKNRRHNHLKLLRRKKALWDELHGITHEVEEEDYSDLDRKPPNVVAAGRAMAEREGGLNKYMNNPEELAKGREMLWH